jgi:hypothetical protein
MMIFLDEMTKHGKMCLVALLSQALRNQRNRRIQLRSSQTRSNPVKPKRLVWRGSAGDTNHHRWCIVPRNPQFIGGEISCHASHASLSSLSGFSDTSPYPPLRTHFFLPSSQTQSNPVKPSQTKTDGLAPALHPGSRRVPASCQLPSFSACPTLSRK